ncbi:UNKNOWN [Stylonychia lemnae]|uniref:Uncharacterized protein n=1 Tax=Stylonychia lemnae TaxID=5949 RepID=A0A078ASE7_STYLE|nr:UNKNOWN [Stylonychia lemnae]|eukprot:CDW84896.1 UNKNOWN [Stylonychia lemnae]
MNTHNQIDTTTNGNQPDFNLIKPNKYHNQRSQRASNPMNQQLLSQNIDMSMVNRASFALGEINQQFKTLDERQNQRPIPQTKKPQSSQNTQRNLNLVQASNSNIFDARIKVVHQRRSSNNSHQSMGLQIPGKNIQPLNQLSALKDIYTINPLQNPNHSMINDGGEISIIQQDNQTFSRRQRTIDFIDRTQEIRNIQEQIKGEIAASNSNKSYCDLNMTQSNLNQNDDNSISNLSMDQGHIFKTNQKKDPVVDEFIIKKSKLQYIQCGNKKIKVKSIQRYGSGTRRPDLKTGSTGLSKLQSVRSYNDGSKIQITDQLKPVDDDSQLYHNFISDSSILDIDKENTNTLNRHQTFFSGGNPTKDREVILQKVNNARLRKYSRQQNEKSIEQQHQAQNMNNNKQFQQFRKRFALSKNVSSKNMQQLGDNNTNKESQHNKQFNQTKELIFQSKIQSTPYFNRTSQNVSENVANMQITFNSQQFKSINTENETGHEIQPSNTNIFRRSRNSMHIQGTQLSQPQISQNLFNTSNEQDQCHSHQINKKLMKSPIIKIPQCIILKPNQSYQVDQNQPITFRNAEQSTNANSYRQESNQKLDSSNKNQKSKLSSNCPLPKSQLSSSRTLQRQTSYINPADLTNLKSSPPSQSQVEETFAQMESPTTQSKDEFRKFFYYSSENGHKLDIRNLNPDSFRLKDHQILLNTKNSNSDQSQKQSSGQSNKLQQSANSQFQMTADFTQLIADKQYDPNYNDNREDLCSLGIFKQGHENKTSEQKQQLMVTFMNNFYP